MFSLRLLLVLYKAILCFSLIQDDVNYIGKNLEVRFGVVNNLNGNNLNFVAQISLTNRGIKPISKDNWEIFFNCIYMIEPDHDLSNGYQIPGTGFIFFHINGGLFKMIPSNEFQTLESDKKRSFEIVIQNWSVSRTDFQPNWYVSADGMTSQVIESTQDLNEFVGDFSSPSQYKRYAEDKYKPYTPEKRFELYTPLLGDYLKRMPKKLVIPEPVEVSFADNTLSFSPLDWSLKCTDFHDECLMLKEHFQFTENVESSNVLEIFQGNVDLDYTNLIEDESYSIVINSTSIQIKSPTSAGAYYAVQTFISLAKQDMDQWLIPMVQIKDAPRFKYRGFFLDVARNFKSKEDVIEMLQMMGQYKLNQFHFHLSDDEGWRLELECCPELTDVGSRRAHDTAGKSSIYPQYGSGPQGDKEFFSIDDYKEILEEAVKHHIRVIPEIDLPGHANAAIQSNLIKYENLLNTSPVEAERILISDVNDTTNALSVQMFLENAVNPCINGTYDFVESVVQGLYDLHSGIQDLTIFHLGGDEIANVWLQSPKCSEFLKQHSDSFPQSFDQLVEYFIRRSGLRVQTVDPYLNIGLWEDGAINNDNEPYHKDAFYSNDVYGYAWQNVWEWGHANRAYKLANSGYKVVLSQATHLYFDQPYEADPEERGFYWASRFTSLHKVFNFLPDDIYANCDFKRTGDPYSTDQMCAEHSCDKLNKPENIIGMQALLWSEVVKTKSHLHYMAFPRILAFAERAWHKAKWELDKNVNSREEDYWRFVDFLNKVEVPRLKKAGVLFRLSPPAAKYVGTNVETMCEFMGFDIAYRLVGEDSWKKVHCGSTIILRDKTDIELQTADPESGRRSRSSFLTTNSSSRNKISLLTASLWAFLCIIKLL